MNFILRFWAIFIVTLKRLVAQRGLALAALLGISVAVALTMSIPIYANGVYQRILNTEIKDRSTGLRPQFAFMYRFIGSWDGPVKLSELAPVDAYLSGPVADEIGLPKQTFVRFLQTDTMRLYPQKNDQYSNLGVPLEWITFGTLNSLQEHIQILEGVYPNSSPTDSQTPVDVLISEKLATATGMQVGEIYTAYAEAKAEQTTITTRIPVRISGIWKAIDPTESYWFYSIDAFGPILIVPEDTFTTRITSAQNDSVYLAVWYWLMDGAHIYSDEVPDLIDRIARTQARAVSLLSSIRLDASPEGMLQTFQKSANSLTIFLYAFSIPILGMTFTFIGLVGDMVIGQRRNEIAVLRSRGATIFQVIGIAALEGILLGLVGLAVGSPGASAIATFFSRAITFMDFSASSQITADITFNALRFGLIAVGISLLFIVVPTICAARHTIITYKQDRARVTRRPWWQRAWVDLMLLIPAAYGMYLMKQQGGLVIPGQDTTQAMDPFQNPLLLLVPALGIFALTLLILRILPLLMSLVAWIVSKTSSVGLLMATRYLSRTAGGYNAPLILLILTLSLSIFTASLAQTLDRHVYDQIYYKVGADMSVVELGESTDPVETPNRQERTTPQSSESTTNSTLTISQPQWLFLPVSDHLKVPGVTAAARVKRSSFSLTINGNSIISDFIGVDRVDFSRVAYWRRDFAPELLGSLMNDLARTTEGVLVSRDILNRGVRIGDNLRISDYDNNETRNIDYKVVGVFDYFPTWYPGEYPLVVGNLDYYFERLGGKSPYNVWLGLSPSANITSVTKGIGDLYNLVLGQTIARDELYTAQSRPERQGFFGLLSVGFTALALLTILGFLLYAFFSFRRRFIELGMLRAIGLSAFQMIVFLGSELAFLFIVGIGAGTGLGIWISNLFIPELQVGNGMAARIPPFLVQIDWPSVFRIYILFGLLFIIAIAILTFMLLRMKIFQAIKLGEVV